MIIDFKYWLKVFQKILILLFSILSIYIAFKISIFYIPFLVAFILSQLIEPIIKFFMKKFKMKRKLSAILIFIIVLSIIIGLISWGIITLVSEISNLLNNSNFYFEKIYNTSQNLISNIDFTKFNNIQLSTELNTIIANSAGEFINTASTWLKTILTNFLNTVTSLPRIGLCIVITILALYFLCTDKIYILDQIEHHLPEQWVKKLTKHVKAIGKAIGCYLKAQLKLVCIAFIISLIGLYIFSLVGMNVKYPFITALVIAIVDALPIFGAGTIILPWAIWSACSGDIVLGISLLSLWLIMSILRQIIEPKIVSRTNWNSSNIHINSNVHRI